MPEGPFKGVPFLLQDLGVRVKNWPRTSGSRFAAIEADGEDSVLTERYRAAGLVLVGKPNTPQSGIPGVTPSANLGPCRTPWHLDHISGGSSGGAASAVAAAWSAGARQRRARLDPHSGRVLRACGPGSRDRNPNGVHDTDRVIGFGVDHVLTRTVRDSAAMLDASAAPQPASSPRLPKQTRQFLEG